MTKTITLSLAKSLILESVKNETFFRGNVDKATDVKATTMAYHEQAGNEAYHERMLERALQTNLANLLTYFSEYISDNGQTTGDNIIDLSEANDVITITLSVGDRFNSGYTTPLARLSSKFIEESMLTDWWKPINEKQSALYAQFVERDLAAIKRCFNKTAPKAPSYAYPTEIQTEGTTIELTVGEEVTVTYEINADAIDDVEARVGDMSLVEVGRSEQGFTLLGKHRGHTLLEMYSRHNPEVAKVLHVYVREEG